MTISDIVGPIEHDGKSRSQGAVSSYTLIRKSSVHSEKQNKQHQELRNNDTKKKSRYVGYIGILLIEMFNHEFISILILQ